MTLLFPMLLLLAAALCAPAYLVSRRNGDESIWLLASALPATVLWLVLTGAGYGAQSLSNLIEVLWILAAAVALSYLKVFVVDRHWGKPRQATYGLLALLTAVALLLRTFMPVLPE